MRIRDGKVVEHEHVDPSLTVLTGQELFGFCTVRYVDDFAAFCFQCRRGDGTRESTPFPGEPA